MKLGNFMSMIKSGFIGVFPKDTDDGDEICLRFKEDNFQIYYEKQWFTVPSQEAFGFEKDRGLTTVSGDIYLMDPTEWELIHMEGSL